MFRAKILVVDDNEIDRDIYAALCKNLNYEVKAAVDGESGLEIAKTWLPDLILLDIYLPGLSGIQVLDQIREIRELTNVTIVLISADSTTDTRLIGLAKEANQFLNKPINTQELAIQMQFWIERKTKRDKLQEVNEKLLKEKEVLGQYFSGDVIDKITSGDLTTSMTGENTIASILFFDIRGFTTISEKIEPNEVADLLNLIFTDMMDLILSYGGSVNKLLGDAILATFGCPIQSDKDAYNAITCALAMCDSMNNFNMVRPSYIKDEVRVGIGITTGRVFAGNIGSFRRMEYTVIGDAVNTASRLQNLTKKAGVEVIIDGNTLDAAGKDSFRTSKVTVKGIRGKTEEVKIYALRGMKEKDKEKNYSMQFF